MKRFLMLDMLAVLLLAGCLAGPRPRGSGAVFMVPALPPIVVLEAEPYYQHGGYFYYYRDNRWSYSQSRSGPWVALPRDRYPKEVKFKGRGDERGGGENRGRDERDKDENGKNEKDKGENRGQDKRDRD